MQLIPQSSFWRTTLLIWLVLLLTQVSTLWFAVYYLYLPGIKQNAKLVALEVDTIQLMVDSESRNELLARLKKQHNIEVTSNPDLIPDRYDGLLADFFLNPMRRRVAPNTDVRLSFSPSPSLCINTPRLGALWIRFPLENIGQYEAVIVLAWVIGTSGLAFFIAFWFVGQLNRPLKRLEDELRFLAVLNMRMTVPEHELSMDIPLLIFMRI